MHRPSPALAVPSSPARRPRTPARSTALAAVALVALAVGAPVHVSAQDADPADVETIDAIITALYDVISGDAGEERNWNRWRSLFVEGATLSAVGQTPDGQVRRTIMTPDSWIERSGEMIIRDGFVEGEIGRTTEQYGLIAHSFSTYVSFRSRTDTEPFQRGINSFQLMNDGERWWVVSVFWQGESAAYPIPETYVGDIGEWQ